MGVASNGAFDAIKGTALPIYYVLAEGAEVSSGQLAGFPAALFLALIGLGGGWQRRRNHNFGLDDEDFLDD